METEKIAIRVDHISKNFKVFNDKGYTLKERLLFSKRRKYSHRCVLNNISFEVKRGEAVGLIGENGCGKSTTLKMLSRIMFPDQGTITMDGRVSALIELGAGFHPDMSGRENIYINAAIFGLSRAEIDRRLQTIIDFSELGKYIDNPVRTYSSGMYMRLAFSIAINVDADILLVDEILAVGDANFQAKCFNKMREIKASGTTIVIVSHSLGQIEQICDRTIWICNGEIRENGNPYDVHRSYMEYMGQKQEKPQEVVAVQESSDCDDETESACTATNTEETAETQNTDPAEEKQIRNRWGNRKAKITDVRLLNPNGEASTAFPVGGTMIVEADYILKDGLESPLFGFGIFRNDGMHCYGTNTGIDNISSTDVPRRGTYRVTIDNCPLMAGEYTLDVAIAEEMGLDCDYYKGAIQFKVYSTVRDVGNVYLSHAWEFVQ